MRSIFLIGAIATAALISSTPLMAQDDSGRRFNVTLEGENEVPVLGDLDGTGTATIRINPGKGQLCYSIRVSGIGPSTAAHVHEAPAGVAGPVVQGLQAPTGGSSNGCIAIGKELALEIIRDPSNYYVNIHNAEFPMGALRGQLGQ